MRVLIRVGLDLTRRIGIRWLRGAGAAQAAARATTHGGGLAGLGRKWLSGLGFELGLHEENAGATGIAFRGLGQGAGAGQRRTAAAHGREAPARNRAHEKAGEQREKGLAMMPTSTRSFSSRWG
jgi:hypothetical protein